jgi:invasion protein IalB
MLHRFCLLTYCIAAFLTAFSVNGAFAQADNPQITSRNFGDWSLRCRPASESDKEGSNCEVALTLQQRGEEGPIAKIAFGKPVPGELIQALVIVPNNVGFPSSVKIVTESKDLPDIELAWRRCLPGGCFAEAKPNEQAIQKIRRLDGPGLLTFRDAQDHNVAVRISFKGLGQALEALEKTK